MIVRYVFSFVFLFMFCILSFSAFASNNEILKCAVDEERYNAYMNNASEWFDSARDILERQNLSPLWLYLMLTESGGNAFAVSKKGAVGPWQLTPLIAKKFGCTDRRNVEQSTFAAAMYIKKLMKDFNGNVEKVIQAYNMGGSNLRKLGKPTREAKHLSWVVVCLFQNDPLGLSEK